VGFRPAVFRLARQAGLSGIVRNDSEGVWIELEGPPEEVRDFPALLRAGAPPLARIDALEVSELAPLGETTFRVTASREGAATAASIPADSATCAACLRELFDPGDRRYRYPFINCTDCGPRYTIVRDIPYDRSRTTMAAFRLCAPCRAEYEDPASRRFHAEPNACPECGPRLELSAPGRAALLREDALAAAIDMLRAGQIVAIKGIGGFHLAADASSEETLRRLRERKKRPAKPFGLMARSLREIEAICEVEAAAREALLSPRRPIVLLPARARLARSVAPGLNEHGVMLPYAPLHHLLLKDGPPLLVMTSGNRSEEPIARSDEEALERLAGIADAFLLHNREIHTRADDSVVRIVAGIAQPVRRSRGFVPVPVRLPFEAPPLLAVGSQLKNTVCVTRGGEAFLSPHVGDLDDRGAFAFFVEVIAKMRRLLGSAPERIAHDLHPDYLSTRFALESGLPRVPVQHHHAHIASCLAENGRTQRAIGVAFDGTGCGPRGELWGGEILLADLAGFRRVGHLRALSLPGGEAAIREPWRVAAAVLRDAGEPLDLLRRIGPRLTSVAHLLEKNVASPASTGAGRWFDAVAALCAVRDEVTYEGQAAIELEAAAGPREAEPFGFAIPGDGGASFEVDLRPCVREIAAQLRGGAETAEISARFHATLAAAVHAACSRAREQSGVHVVALSGGCFQNRRLTELCASALEADSFEVLLHRQVPPNDGGLSLGQAAVAAWRTRER